MHCYWNSHCCDKSILCCIVCYTHIWNFFKKHSQIMIMQTLNLVYSKDTSQTSVKTKPSPITLAAKQGTSNNLAHTTPPPYSTPPDRMNTNNLWYGGYQRTIFDSDNPLVAISYLGASNCRKGSEHGMESLERTFIWKCNAYSILLTKQINFTQKQWDGCFQSKIKIKILGFEKHQIKLKNTITTCKHQGGGLLKYITDREVQRPF